MVSALLFSWDNGSTLQAYLQAPDTFSPHIFHHCFTKNPVISRRTKLGKLINLLVCFTRHFFLLKDIFFLLSLLINIWPLFSMCMWWGVNGMFPFKAFRAISEMAFIRPSEAVQILLFSGKDWINSSRRDRLFFRHRNITFPSPYQ